MKLKNPKSLNQVRKELGKLYWIVCHRPAALQPVKTAVNALGRMVDATFVALTYAKFTGQDVSKAHRKFITGR